MGDGQQKPIEDVSKGDMVVDAYGQLQQVVETGRRWAEDVVEMTSRGSCLKTIVTKDHPYLSSSGEFKPIGEWDVVEGRQRWEGDYLVFPREVDYAFQGKAYVRTSDYFTDEWMKYRNGRIYWTKRPHESGFPVVLDVTEDWAYFLGLYCAEGSATKGGLVALSFSMSEVDTLAQDAKVFLESLGLNVAVDTFPEKNTVIVRTGSKTLARVLRKACGSGSHKKKVPFGMIDSQREHFLRGVILGDGHITESKSVLNVASWGLIRDIQGLSWGLGMFPTLQKSERPDGRVSWHLVYQGESYHRLMSIVRQTEQVADWTFGNDQFVFRKLTGVTDTEPTMVYNLETTGSHSYIANGLSVHNCQYCGKKFDSSELNIDHVKPTSRGGKTTWTNTVLSCIPCNDRKANRTPEEAGMRLLREPHVPSSEEVRRGYLQRVMSRISYKPPSWEALLGDMYWNVQLKA
jgi:5-methylcytosine-specific restriction endonuclease McrA